jgi:uncharacterized membrane protein
MLLIDDLLLWLPLKGIIALARKLQEIAEGEAVDDVAKLRAQLQEAQMRFEMDEITEAEYQRQEDEILARLAALQPTKA